jgi:hypothetical protein
MQMYPTTVGAIKKLDNEGYKAAARWFLLIPCTCTANHMLPAWPAY